MARILTKAECEKISKLRKQLRSITPDGWMYESNDENKVTWFNNNTNEYFETDFAGRVLFSDMKTLTRSRASEMGRLAGDIMAV